MCEQYIVTWNRETCQVACLNPERVPVRSDGPFYVSGTMTEAEARQAAQARAAEFEIIG